MIFGRQVAILFVFFRPDGRAPESPKFSFVPYLTLSFYFRSYQVSDSIVEKVTGDGQTQILWLFVSRTC